MSDIDERKLSQLFHFDITGKTVEAKATLAQAIETMARSGKTCLLVRLNGDKPVGIISEHDIVQAFAHMGEGAKKAQVVDYMTIDVIVAREHDTLDHALGLMAKHNIRHLPVLSGKGGIVDFVSVIDLVVRKMVLPSKGRSDCA